MTIILTVVVRKIYFVCKKKICERIVYALNIFICQQKQAEKCNMKTALIFDLFSFHILKCTCKDYLRNESE